MNTPIIQYYPKGQLERTGQTINGQKEGLWTYYHENGKKRLEGNYKNNKSDGSWFEWYDNGRLAEEGIYINGEYTVINFWLENGEQLLKDGSGKTIKKFGAGEIDVFEQYFENGKFVGEKRI